MQMVEQPGKPASQLRRGVQSQVVWIVCAQVDSARSRPVMPYCSNNVELWCKGHMSWTSAGMWGENRDRDVLTGHMSVFDTQEHNAQCTTPASNLSLPSIPSFKNAELRIK